MENKIFIDIETVSGATMPSLDELKANAPKTMTKPETIEKWAKENQLEVYKKQALDSMQGRIICIGFAFRGIIYDLCGDEKQTIVNFQVQIKSIIEEICSPLIFIGWNISGFDIPWLWRKAIQYDLRDLRKAIPKDNRLLCIDLMKVWQADYRDYVSLNNCAKFLNIPHETENGSCVYDWWKAGAIDKITEHCKSDLETTIKIYERIFE